MDIIYKFSLNEETGKIEMSEIKDYEEKETSIYSGSKSTYYRYKGDSCFKYIYDKDIDVYKHNHLYTFNPDAVRARNIIQKFIGVKYDKAIADADIWLAVLQKLNDV